MVVIAGLVVTIVGVAGLSVQAVRGNRVVGVQRAARTVHDAAVDDAYYQCIDTQAHSLVTPDEPVIFDASLGDLVTLLKGAGSWVTIADPASSAVVRLSLRNDVPGNRTCLGSVVVATYAEPHGGVRVRIGSGSHVPGSGPPPAPPL